MVDVTMTTSIILNQSCILACIWDFFSTGISIGRTWLKFEPTTYSEMQRTLWISAVVDGLLIYCLGETAAWCTSQGPYKCSTINIKQIWFCEKEPTSSPEEKRVSIVFVFRSTVSCSRQQCVLTFKVRVVEWVRVKKYLHFLGPGTTLKPPPRPTLKEKNRGYQDPFSLCLTETVACATVDLHAVLFNSWQTSLYMVVDVLSQCTVWRWSASNQTSCETNSYC